MMKNIDRRKRTLSGALISGSTIALLFAGCGGGGGTEKTPDTSVPPVKLDAALATGGIIAATGGVLATGGSTTVDALAATGGTIAIDASPDLAIITPPDATKIDTSPADAGLPDAPPAVDAATDLPPADALTRDAGGDTFVNNSTCPTPVFAQTLGGPISTIHASAINKVGAVSIVTEIWPARGTTFLGKPATNAGSADLFLSNLVPAATGVAFEPVWNFSSGDEADQFGTKVANSGDGKTGVIGQFLGTMAFGTKQITNPSADDRNFIAGLNNADGVGIWAKSVDLAQGRLFAIAGNLKQDFFVVCGSATNAASPLVTGGTNKGGSDIVLAAIKASDGTTIWSKLIGTTGDEKCAAASLDDNGTAYFAGTLTRALDFGTGALAVAPASPTSDAGANLVSSSLWITKVDPSGTVLAAAAFGSAPGLVVTQPSTSGNPISLAIDAQGNALVAGLFGYADMNFGNTTLPANNSGKNAFVAKLGSTLVPLWARSFVSPITKTAEYIAIRDLGANSAGNVIIAGDFLGTVNFGTTGLPLDSKSKDQGSDIFIAQLSGATGNTTCSLGFGQIPDGTLTPTQGVNSITINRLGTGTQQDQLTIAGEFRGSLDFGKPNTAITAGVAGVQAGFILLMQP